MKRELVRLVRTPDGRVVLDPSGRLPGRGAYLCRTAACFDAAARRRALEHALGVAIPSELAAQLAGGPDALTDIPALATGLGSDPSPDTTTPGGPDGQK